MEKRSGLVMTGPKDGEFVSAHGEKLKVPVAHKVSPSYADFAFDSVDDVLSTVDTFVYRYTAMWFHDDEQNRDAKYGFWVPEDEKSPSEFVIKHLAQFYVDHSRAKSGDK